MNAEPKIAIIEMQLRIQSSSKHANREKRALESIRRFVLVRCDARRRSGDEYELRIPYYTEEGLDKIMAELLEEICQEAYIENCVSETEARLGGTDRQW